MSTCVRRQWLPPISLFIFIDCHMSDDASQHTRACSRNRSHKRRAQVAEHLFGWQLVAVLMFSSCSLCFSLFLSIGKIPHTYFPILFNEASDWCLDNVSNDNCSSLLYIIIIITDVFSSTWTDHCWVLLTQASTDTDRRARCIREQLCHQTDELMDIRWLDFLNDVFAADMNVCCLLREMSYQWPDGEIIVTNRNRRRSERRSIKSDYLSDEDVVFSRRFISA